MKSAEQLSLGRRCKNAAEYLLFSLFYALARALPRETALALGRPLGDAACFLLPGRRRTARQNIRLAFPEMAPREVDRHVREMFRHIGISTMELLRIDLLRGEQDLRDLFQIEGVEHLRDAFELGKGVIILTGHIGFWEAGSFFLPQLGFVVDFVAMAMRNPYLDRRLQQLREAGGARFINKRHAARKIIRSLAENRAVGILLDQHTSPREAVSVDFFGRPAYTTPVISEIAARNGTPIVPVFCYRTRENRYHVLIEPMLQLERTTEPAGVAAQTALLAACIETAIRRNIDQWFWLHRRWRHTSPPP
jgi:KDO2-lipid IV(A) lauroyltransferase